MVDADVKSYFDTIPCGPLMDRLEDEISDGKMLALVEAFLGQDILDGLRRWTPTMGTPQGAVLSPLLANRNHRACPRLELGDVMPLGGTG